jgi:RNA polymerase sigma factor
MSEKYNEKIQIEGIINRIKKGDTLLRNEFIEKNIPFIIRVLSNVINRYIDTKNNEEFSIGLTSFNESIDSFNVEKNSNFFYFSEQVIRRRTIDYIRSNKRNNIVFPFTYFLNDEDDDFVEKYVVEEQINGYDGIEIKQEFILFEEILKMFKVSLQELVLCSPKHRDSKLLSIKIAKIICNNDILYNKLYKNKRIPRTDIMKSINVSVRTIERNRKFIIAVSLILKSDFTVLKEYIENVVEYED